MSDPTRYRFVGSNHYHDGERLEHGDVVELNEGERQYFAHKFEPVEDDSEGGDADAEAETADDETDDTDTDDTDAGDASYETYSRDELEAMEWGDLRDLAKESDAEEIDGRSNRDDILETLSED